MYSATTTVIWRSENGRYDIEKRVAVYIDGSREISYTLATDHDRYHLYRSIIGTYYEPTHMPKYVRKAIERVCFRTPVDHQPSIES